MNAALIRFGGNRSASNAPVVSGASVEPVCGPPTLGRLLKTGYTACPWRRSAGRSQGTRPRPWRKPAGSFPPVRSGSPQASGSRPGPRWEPRAWQAGSGSARTREPLALRRLRRPSAVSRGSPHTRPRRSPGRTAPAAPSLRYPRRPEPSRLPVRSTAHPPPSETPSRSRSARHRAPSAAHPVRRIASRQPGGC